jgi:hypothetical protein
MRLLLASTQSWFSLAKLTVALDRAGFQPGVLAPHALDISALGAHRARHPLNPFAVKTSAVRAMNEFKPQAVIAGDDEMALVLRDLARNPPPDLEAVARGALHHSPGASPSQSAAFDRAAGLTLARSLGVPTPPIESLEGEAPLPSDFPFPAFLKEDGSWGGRGVRWVEDRRALREAVGRAKARAPFLWAAKRFLINGDNAAWSSATRTPTLSLQKAVEGHPATVSLACWQGEVLAFVGLEVLQTAFERGPATVVRRIRHPDITLAVRKLIPALGLSGLVGLDFMIEESTGRAFLIEVNPRATPTAHLTDDAGRSLAQCLFNRMNGLAPPRSYRSLAGQIVTLVPGEERRDPHSHWLSGNTTDLDDAPQALLSLAARSAGARRSLRSLLQKPGWSSANIRSPSPPPSASYRP